MIAEQTETPEYVGPGMVARRYGVDPDTVADWQTRGVTIAGRRIKLQSVMIGGRRKTTWDWVAEFHRACNDDQPVAAETPSQQQRRAKADQEKLAEKLKRKGKS